MPSADSLTTSALVKSSKSFRARGVNEAHGPDRQSVSGVGKMNVDKCGGTTAYTSLAAAAIFGQCLT